jgi:hypothetical protein
MPSKPIRIETCPVLPLFAYFHASTVSRFSFLDRFALLIRMIRTAAPSNAFQTSAILFEEPTANQSSCGGSFKLSLYVNMKVSLMVT